MRPPRSPPRTRERSMPRSRASLRIEGEAAAATPALGSPSGSADCSSSSFCFGSSLGSGSGCLFSDFASVLVPPDGCAAPGSLNETRRCPTLILSPVFTKIFVTLPGAVEGMVATAFSFSNSSNGWSLATSSPSLTKRLTTVPESTPSPSGGSFTSIVLQRIQKS